MRAFAMAGSIAVAAFASLAGGAPEIVSFD